MSNPLAHPVAHTPGPWATYDNPAAGDYFQIGVTSNAPELTDTDHDGYDVAFCGPIGVERSLDECRANARLIATAPELLAALQEAWPYVPDHHGPVQARIKAALEKAGVL